LVILKGNVAGCRLISSNIRPKAENLYNETEHSVESV
jgi:hypothetical protein